MQQSLIRSPGRRRRADGAAGPAFGEGPLLSACYAIIIFTIVVQGMTLASVLRLVQMNGATAAPIPALVAAFRPLPPDQAEPNQPPQIASALLGDKDGRYVGQPDWFRPAALISPPRDSSSAA